MNYDSIRMCRERLKEIAILRIMLIHALSWLDYVQSPLSLTVKY